MATLRHRHVDLVLLDVQMPGINGFEVCAYLKQAPETRLIPIALVTGLNAREHKIRGLQAGADDFIGKPFDPEELQARVASLVRLKQYTDDLDSTEGILRSLALMIKARDRFHRRTLRATGHYAVALGATWAICRKISRRSIAALSARHRQRRPGCAPAQGVGPHRRAVRDDEAAHRNRRPVVRRAACRCGSCAGSSASITSASMAAIIPTACATTNFPCWRRSSARRSLRCGHRRAAVSARASARVCLH